MKKLLKKTQKFPGSYWKKPESLLVQTPKSEMFILMKLMSESEMFILVRHPCTKILIIC